MKLTLATLILSLSTPALAVGPQDTRTQLKPTPNLERRYETTHTLTGEYEWDRSNLYLVTELETDVPIGKVGQPQGSTALGSHDTGFVSFQKWYRRDPQLNFVHEFYGFYTLIPFSMNTWAMADVSEDSHEDVQALSDFLKMAAREGYPISGTLKVLHVEDVNLGQMTHYLTKVNINVDYDKTLEVDARTSFGETQVDSAR